MPKDQLIIGIDVGSTTVKCVIVDSRSREILWSRYERHETRQAARLSDLLSEAEEKFPQVKTSPAQAFITGSGAGPLAAPLGAKFVQEVNAVTLAVEKLHPDVNSVVELGGQDAKIIIFKKQSDSGARNVITSMNDKCASGTGATIDKCILKVGMSQEQLSSLNFDAEKLHHVAAKCGVFAETDIVNLIKAGVPAGEVINSLADAIVMQNLSVLARGNTLAEKVLLLGGPNAYLPFLQQCWVKRIPESWQERGRVIPDVPASELIFVPDNAEYYAAYGSVIYGLEQQQQSFYKGVDGLVEFVEQGRKEKLLACSDPGLFSDAETLATFNAQYKLAPFKAKPLAVGKTIKAYIGLDGGSTSSKAVLIDGKGDILKKEYQLSKGNPIQDTKEILLRFRQYAESQGSKLEVLGFGVTGYAAEILKQTINPDANIVETIAHMQSAKTYCGDDVDVVCDIGGQDIKVLFLENGLVKNFRLSNQCSAGNGMLLQAMSDQFGVKVTDYADIAFSAELSPKFSYGCAVFLDTDRVNFQKEGYSKEEIFAGLARVLPKNVWQYVVQVSRMSELGRKFVLQGGTQYNLAAVKAQVDYINERVPGAEVLVHPHCGEAGAIGAALEAKRVVEKKGESSFIGLDAAIDMQYTTRTDEETRCNFCENNCSRTFIDTTTPDGHSSRYIAGFSCEKGMVESKQAVVALHKERKRLKAAYPNLVDVEANLVFKSIFQPKPMPDKDRVLDFENVSRTLWGYGLVRRKFIKRKMLRSTGAQQQQRSKIRIGIPRALNVYTLAPFMRTYLESLGIEKRNIIFSDHTSEELWLEGGKYGSIDPCFPAKVSLAHIHNLLTHKQRRQKLDFIWFPAVTHIEGIVSNTAAQATCPLVAGTPAVSYAAFTKEKDYFAGYGIKYVDRVLNFELLDVLRQQLLESWGDLLSITEDENDWACDQAWQAMAFCDETLQSRGLEILTEAEKNNDVVLLLLGRPYHLDPGLNHEVMDEFQSLGYPTITIRSIPKDINYLKRFFNDEIESGKIEDVYDIRDVWPENYSVNSSLKVWGAKFAVRHPNVAVLDLSSFKCGHDAPTYGIIDEIISASKTPYMALHDIDANKPSGSIAIRVKTYAYTLERYKEFLQRESEKKTDFEISITNKRIELIQAAQQKNKMQFKQLAPVLWHELQAFNEEYLDQLPQSLSRLLYKPEKNRKVNELIVEFDFVKNKLNARDELSRQQIQYIEQLSDYELDKNNQDQQKTNA